MQNNGRNLLFTPLSIKSLFRYIQYVSASCFLCLTLYLSPFLSPSLHFTFISAHFVLDLLAPPGDLRFKGTSVSHNKAASNEARKGDLCVGALYKVHLCTR